MRRDWPSTTDPFQAVSLNGRGQPLPDEKNACSQWCFSLWWTELKVGLRSACYAHCVREVCLLRTLCAWGVLATPIVCVRGVCYAHCVRKKCLLRTLCAWGVFATHIVCARSACYAHCVREKCMLRTLCVREVLATHIVCARSACYAHCVREGCLLRAFIPTWTAR